MLPRIMDVWKENKVTLKLAFPIITGQVSQMLMGLIDTLMIGHIGTTELAAAAMTNVLFNFPFVLGIGLFIAVSVMVSHAHGADNDEEAGEAFRNGYLMALVLGVVLAAGLLGTLPFLDLLHQPEDVVAAIPDYLIWMALSLIPSIPMFTIKNFAEAKNRPWTVLWIMMGGVALNIVLNYLLIFGKFGLPELGLAGAGIATFLARLSTWWALWTYQKKSRALASARPKRWLKPLDQKICLQTAKIALPATGQLTMEFGSFAAAAILIGQFGSVSLAAHQITLSCAAFTFMIPLGLALAVTIRVGHTVGAGENERCNRIVIGAHITAFCMMGLTAAAFLLAGEPIAGMFSQDSEVIAVTASLFVYAAAFQIFDGAQVISMGALRGLKDVNIPTAIIFVSFWIIGIPLGAALAFSSDMEARGLWIGLAMGLAVASVVLGIRLKQKLSKLHRSE
ncbi:MAG: MATE family efflux transporter [Verrucomicrobiota bacterium]